MFHLSSENELIEGCRKSNRLAQRQLYEQYAPKMLALCKRYIANEFEAEEALINSFMKVYNKISQYKAEGSFEGWIRRIMVNECLNHLRKQKFLYAEVNIQNVSNKEDFSQYESELQAEELMGFVNRLPNGYRTIFNLYAIEGYSHQEIAEMLEISESTSKSQLSRARVLLQKYIKENDNKLNNIYHG